MTKLNEQNEMSRHVIVVGCGGNIGSHMIPHLARSSNVGRVTLIDHDTYEPKNLKAQDIVPSDVGKSKATVQKRRLKKINPALEVTAMVERIENVPLHHRKGDVILAGLDSRRARQFVNETSWRLGIPWIDAGVDGPNLLARVSVFYPGEEKGCLECGWSPEDYAAVEQTYACAPGSGEAAATNAPSSLGALAASLAVIECGKILSPLNGSGDDEPTSFQIMLDAAYHNFYLTRLHYNGECRMPLHAEPVIRCEASVARNLRIEEFSGQGRLEVLGQSFVTQLVCRECGHPHFVLELRVSFERRQNRGKGARPCTECGGELVATGFGTSESVNAAALPPGLMCRTLGAIGVREGDVLGIRDEHGYRRYVEVDSRGEKTPGTRR